VRGVSKAKIESLPILGSTFKNASQFPEAELVRRLRFWLVQFPALSICQLDRVLVVTSTQHQIPIVAVPSTVFAWRAIDHKLALVVRGRRTSTFSSNFCPSHKECFVWSARSSPVSGWTRISNPSRCSINQGTTWPNCAGKNAT
jgi:hypothetical protein